MVKKNQPNTVMEGRGVKTITNSLPRTGVTGEKLECTVSVETEMKQFVYFIVDWGDGCWSYDGPYRGGSNGSLWHRYQKSGTFSVRSLCICLDQDAQTGWSEPADVEITGEPSVLSYLVGGKSIASPDLQWAGYLFDEYHRMEELECSVLEDTASWPSDFAVEYTTDHGQSWYSLPKYFYHYDYIEHRYVPRMNFPNPQGKTLLFALDGIVANGIRICAKEVPEGKNVKLEICDLCITGGQEALFYTSRQGMFDADLNNLFTIYGTAASEPNHTWGDPFRSGVLLMGSAEWVEWNGVKLRWSADPAIQDAYRNTLVNGIRTGEDGWSGHDGFVWATAHGKDHLGHQYHYTQNAFFLIEARNYLLMRNEDKAFLKAVNHCGQKIEDRIDAAMSYLLIALEGESGVLTIRDPNNQATAGEETGSCSSNYWDRYSAFGYQSSYENVLFYEAVLAMIDLEEFRGRPEKAEYYRNLAEKTRKAFNDLFWDEEKGRYITSVNVNGDRLDFGITFCNFMACEAGLASKEQAERIYSWIDGRRIIPGDTSQGKDIYHFVHSARTNTLDVAAVYNNGYYWVNWNGDMYCYEKDGQAHGAYGNQMQNGGSIFYTSYYDLMGRLRYFAPEDAFARFDAILHEFHRRNQLRVFPYPTEIGYVEGIIGEFPESGMVPSVFVEGFLGITAAQKGLLIVPKLPAALSFAGVRAYRYLGRCYSIRVDRRVSAPKLEQKEDGTWYLELPASGQWLVAEQSVEDAAK